jgi:nitroimidazol reductase NimA-like FMN-containing flavoprotein (pyridoxamine 5'-phosphate oxidase superfamily)
MSASREHRDENVLHAVSEVLDCIEHATIATVSAQGRPWNTPVFFARRGGSLYWTSRSDAQHSTNVRDNPHAFIVVYDSSREDSTGAALYIEAQVAELKDTVAIEFAAALIYRRRRKAPPSIGEFRAPSPHRLYHATAVRAWTNVLHHSETVSWVERIEIALNDV